ncbi:MAG: GltB/FmdC/FwdC-like GXGXG domain-containing protein [Planctomycetota bacterium]|jgi:glutamate synthase domain-containing protein 1/glutamate synthase domain-containing protein 3
MDSAEAILNARRKILEEQRLPARRTLEGGCGVIGVIASETLEGRLIIRSCEQMQNRGNGKGGGVAAAGLFPDRATDYAVHVAYLDESVQKEVEKKYIEDRFDVAHAEKLETIDDHRAVGLEVRPPAVQRYFVRARKGALDEFAGQCGISNEKAAEDEFVFQNSFRLNREFYGGSDQPKAFVLSHGRDLMILKGVGYAEQIARYYRLEGARAHVWIGHQRYPTRGRVWHPGGAHPFAGLHEALVHNGDFANYHAITEYLHQRGIEPLFVTDTEVSVLLFDLYARVLNYPLEYVIEALAPTPEGDFERLSKRRQRIYRAIQNAHLNGSPDGPWFFIVARAEPGTGLPQLIGITDVSMLRPQVFALQTGEKSIGAIASEKQAIDAFFEEVTQAHPDVPAQADRYWNARGGSCTDGGAFAFTLTRQNGRTALEVKDKFGNPVTVHEEKSTRAKTCALPVFCASDLEAMGLDETEVGGKGEDGGVGPAGLHRFAFGSGGDSGGKALLASLTARLREGRHSLFFDAVQEVCAKEEGGWRKVLAVLTFLRDRRWDAGGYSRSLLLATLDASIEGVLDALPGRADYRPSDVLRLGVEDAWDAPVPLPLGEAAILVLDAKGFPPEGTKSVSRLLVAGLQNGWKRFIVYRTRGDRFIGCGMGPGTEDVRIDVYGSSGDYLGSGMDGAQLFVHGDAQDQVGQILKAGRLVIFGSVGQTFLYGAKGGEAFVMGSAAGRPLINAVGKIRAIINGTCLDYCAESFMAGEQLGGGFVVINGLAFDERGEVIGLEMKYPGNNLFSLASGGACYLNDPYRTVVESQLNGASFVPFRQADWNVLRPYLQANEEYFGISIRNDLLVVDGVLKWPKEVFRKVVASAATEKLDWSGLPA